ncbi:MAG TPA: 50S ribosomal protein L32 [Ktedonobacterales bacterium]|nr:50S ribosomal protein L32 [Ktedonobacterales bacterium]
MPDRIARPGDAAVGHVRCCSQIFAETVRDGSRAARLLHDNEDEEKTVGALPKKRQTNSRQGHRRQHHKIKIPQLKICPQCRQARLSHHACPNCGTYRGRQVFPVRERRPAAE